MLGFVTDNTGKPSFFPSQPAIKVGSPQLIVDSPQDDDFLAVSMSQGSLSRSDKNPPSGSSEAASSSCVSMHNGGYYDFAVDAENQLLFCCGAWDFSFQVANPSRVLQNIRGHHRDVVTCIVLERDEMDEEKKRAYLVTGSQDCTVIVWEVGNIYIYIYIDIYIYHIHNFVSSHGEAHVMRKFSMMPNKRNSYIWI